MFHRWLPLAVTVSLAVTASGRGDAFDNYVNPILRKVPAADGVKEIKQLTPSMIADNDRVLPDTSAALIVVQTNDNRLAKLLVQPARRKVDAEKSVPILLIDRFVTYKEGEERTVLASGRNVYLFPGFHFHLDIGQVVPESLGGDIRFVVDGAKSFLEPVAKAKMYLLTKALPEATPRKGPRLVVGETFEAGYFNGTYKLYNDGRRSGSLKLMVGERGEIAGSYYSDRDGQKYDVKGKIGTPLYSVQFTIRFPRTEQTFQGWMFTGDGKAIAGFARMEEHETGFYALRVEEE
jgi:hypothetical protein